MKTCTVDGCTRKHIARGYCSAHYQAEKKAGRLENKPHRSVLDRLDDRTEIGPVPPLAPELGPCHLWTGYLLPNGYAVFATTEHGPQYIHRLTWMLTNGPIPEGHLIDHRCFVHHCRNIDHLRLATKVTNGQNASGVRVDSGTGIRGVTEENPGRFRPYCNFMGTRHRGPLFSDKEEAGRYAAQMRRDLFTHNDLDRKP